MSEKYTGGNVGRIPFMEYNGITILSASEEHSVLKAEISEDSLNPYGLVHGGLIYTMMDCTAGVTARADGNAYVTQNSYVNFLSNVKKEPVIYAESDVIRRGRTVTIVHVIVRTEGGQVLADGVVDMFRVS